MKRNSYILVLLIFGLTLLYSQQYNSIETDEYIFDVLTLGNDKDPPVILLHGFPETAHMWMDLQSFLAESGFYVIAPNQRGYSPGARPRRVNEYKIEKLMGDILAIADSLNLDTFHLIGHDWSSAVGWGLASEYPERIISWTALSVPHPGAFALAIKNDELQHKASSYMRLFQWPLIPEIFLKSKEYKNLIEIWEETSNEKIELYLSVLSESGAIRGAVNWYRANYKDLIRGNMEFPKVSVPTLFIWGRDDPAILESGAMLNKNYVNGFYSEKFLNAGHWLIDESFDDIARLILNHITQ